MLHLTSFEAQRDTGGGTPDTPQWGFDLLRPDPGGTIRSLMALGYTPEAAVADLVDNSIAAGAQNIDIDFHWGGVENSSVSVSDDGEGMDETALLHGMTVGGRGLDTDRSARDLGRFGMGLKSASFSQCRQLVVATRRDDGGEWINRTWDIDHVLAAGDWQLLRQPPPDAAPRLAELTGGRPGPGTVVLWRNLTQLVAPGSVAEDAWAQKEFHTHLGRIEAHLGMVFARYLTRRRNPLRLAVNGNIVEPWDPFLDTNNWVDRLPREHPVPGVVISGYVLPHRSRLSDSQYELAGGPRGWLDQQGFYIYRRDRLIVAGGWLQLGFRRDERHKLARIAVDVDAAHDVDWSIDVRKSSATAPPSLAPHLRRIARATRERAAAVMSHRGRPVVRRQTGTPDVTWRQTSRFGVAGYQINRAHPLIVDLLTRHPDVRPAVNALIAMIEQTLPVAQIRMAPEPGPVTPDDRGSAPAAVLDMAGEVLEALVSQGSSGEQALQRLLAMPPFDQFPGLAVQLDQQSD
ncbi:ATP-binding protein [Pseudonocardia sp. WMMC193]|uniref:ATP-binding protein n=1 Tax=Pseudonocardia sp. WMMC193 TaxID=2911965 RepID=UPI001F3BD23D|nr:ATP-binding protein [Pseudonocardia sp. WMMC193]MCF7552179.1 ATP-binding protein [Pseudonocardia sp. WMMC193]